MNYGISYGGIAEKLKRQKILAPSRMCLVGKIVPGGKGGLETLISGSALPTWKEVHTSKEEIRQKCQEACTDEQGTPSKTQI